MSNLADYHFLIPAPGVGSAWITQAARRYWMRFKPVITDDWEMLLYLPVSSSILVTVLASTETAQAAREKAHSLPSHIEVDLVIARDLPEMEALLDARALAGYKSGGQEGAG